MSKAKQKSNRSRVQRFRVQGLETHRNSEVLYGIDTWHLGSNKNIDTRRLQIEKELESLKGQKRDENGESWRDISLLKKEHREFFREYRNALRRVKVIFPEKSKEEGITDFKEK